MSGRYCPAQWPVAGTMRQYWMCDLPPGHEGDHVTYWFGTAIRRSTHAATDASSAPVQGPGAGPGKPKEQQQ